MPPKISQASRLKRSATIGQIKACAGDSCCIVCWNVWAGGSARPTARPNAEDHIFIGEEAIFMDYEIILKRRNHINFPPKGR